MRESGALDAIVLANLAGLASKSDAAPNALFRMNSRRLIMIVPGSGDMSAAHKKSFVSQPLTFLE